MAPASPRRKGLPRPGQAAPVEIAMRGRRLFRRPLTALGMTVRRYRRGAACRPMRAGIHRAPPERSGMIAILNLQSLSRIALRSVWLGRAILAALSAGALLLASAGAATVPVKHHTVHRAY